MYDLIQQVRAVVPFNTPVADLCVDDCYGCPKKLLEYLDMELEDWQQKLDDGHIPNFAEINSLGRRSRKIVTALEKNGLVMN